MDFRFSHIIPEVESLEEDLNIPLDSLRLSVPLIHVLAQLLQLGISQQAGGALYLRLFPASHQSDSVTAGSSSRCTNKSAYRRMGDVK